jgi:hypothetical protein
MNIPLQHAFQITEEDIAAVLRQNAVHIANSGGKSFDDMATDLLGRIDANLAAKAAIKGDSLEDQTSLAQQEIARQLWLMGTLDNAPFEYVQCVAKPALVEALKRELTSLDPLEMAKILDEGFPGLRNMSEGDLILQAYRFGLQDEMQEKIMAIMNAYRIQPPVYIHGTWTHLFGPGSTETTLRILYDTTQGRLIAGQYQQNGRWLDLRQDDLADVEDSLKNANPEALERPAEFGLEVSSGMPSWACTQAPEEAVASNDRPRG